MSYEGKMLEDLNMPTRKEVEDAILRSLFKHNGVIKEFGAGEEIVSEIAVDFNLNLKQLNAFLETTVRKENRLKKSSLWHRLLFRAADNLAKNDLVTRPTKTIHITNKREWMLTEAGYDKALKILGIPLVQKETLSIKSYEVQKIVKKLNEQQRPQNYTPFENSKKVMALTKEVKLRYRGFRQAIIEAYDCKCTVCGMKITSPDSLQWEVEAAHIVPYRLNGKDDIWNGLALCHLHHWAFDVGWFTLDDNYNVQASTQIQYLPNDFGKIGDYNFIFELTKEKQRIYLPDRVEIFPHQNAIDWHRQNIFHH
ncbi:MAG: HNH endonuclease [Bacteroidetes bacterium]|nr:HNH endonuclease [Bacteroidota bacterium]